MISLVANLKGGTGKSTLAFNLAVWLASKGNPVTVFDLDPQATIRDVNKIRIQANCEPRLRIKHKAGDLQSHMEGEVLIDVGTSDMDRFSFALCQADRILIPILPSKIDILATQRFVQSVKEACSDGMPMLYGIINQADTYHGMIESGQAMAEIEKMKDIHLISSHWQQRSIYRRAMSEGLAVFELEPNGKAANEVDNLANILYATSVFQCDAGQPQSVGGSV